MLVKIQGNENERDGGRHAALAEPPYILESLERIGTEVVLLAGGSASMIIVVKSCTVATRVMAVPMSAPALSPPLFLATPPERVAKLVILIRIIAELREC